MSVYDILLDSVMDSKEGLISPTPILKIDSRKNKPPSWNDFCRGPFFQLVVDYRNFPVQYLVKMIFVKWDLNDSTPRLNIDFLLTPMKHSS